MTLDEYLRRHDLDNRRFARLIGVHESTVSRWRTGLMRPGIDSWLAIMKASKGKIGMCDLPARKDQDGIAAGARAGRDG